MLKSDICAGTEVCARTMLPGAMACTVPPLNDCGEDPLALIVGVAVIVTVAVEPEGSEIGPQLILVEVDPEPHVPELIVADTAVKVIPPVNCGDRLSVTTILLARSGPLFCTV